jgi:hypothetical protein
MSKERDQRNLVDFAFQVLATLRQPSGLYCFDRSFDSPQCRGESVRYSLMVLLGLDRARSSGRTDLEAEIEALSAICLDRRDTFTDGDFGLALWAEARRERGRADELIEETVSRATNDAALSTLAGMEIAWLVIGLAHASERSDRANVGLDRVLQHLRQTRLAPSGLAYHTAKSGPRRHLPNFATQIYTVLALTAAARTKRAPWAENAAVELADHLLRLQRPNGGWPWVFHADRAVVVEPYEIYSVHQDAMAPMALLELTDLTGDDRYATAARAGLDWSTGNNELGVDLLDRDARFAHRSIRRRAPFDRVVLAANSAAALAHSPLTWQRDSTLELNATCRPYHLGWILQAWSGREHLVETPASEAR